MTHTHTLRNGRDTHRFSTNDTQSCRETPRIRSYSVTQDETRGPWVQVERGPSSLQLDPALPVR